MPDDKDDAKLRDQAIADAMKGIGLAPSGQKKPADRVFELFQAAIQQGLTSKRDPEVPAPPTVDNIGEGESYVEAGEPAIPPEAPRPLSEWERTVQEKAREAFNEYVRENVSKDAPAGAEVAVDGAFLQEHGGPLMGAVLASLVKSFVPANLDVEVPTKKAEGEPFSEAKAEPQVKLKVDFNRLIGDFVANATRRAEPTEPDEDDA
jgi:hypothetical protein